MKLLEPKIPEPQKALETRFLLDSLVIRSKGGDVGATRDLLREVAPVVRRTCKSVLRGTHADLEDTIQESLVAFIRALPSYRFDGSISHYARRIAFRASLYHRRRSLRWRDRFPLTGNIEDTAVGFSSSPSEGTAWTEQLRDLDRVLGKLPREQAEALMLRFVHDVSANEIASLCDVPLDTIKTRLKRGKTALRRRLALQAVTCIAIVIGLAACNGQIGETGGSAANGDTTTQPGAGPKNSDNASIDDLQALGCDPSTRGTTELAVRRLTKPEILAGLTSLFGSAIMNDPTVKGSLGQIPEQSSIANSQFDNSIVDVEGLEAVASTIADAVFANAGALGQVLGGCDPSNVAQCTDSLVGAFAAKAFRRPPTAQTAQSIRTLVSSIGGTEGLKNGIIRVIISPYFHQHLELGENADECGSNCAPLDSQASRLKLSQYEVASRLSFQLTGAPPDDALLAAAAAGKLGDLDAVKTQAQRLLAAAPARDNWRRIASDWLTINQTSDPDAVVAKDANITNVGLSQEAQEDFKRFVAYEAFDKKSNLHGLFTDNVAFAYTDRLATVFGLATSDSAQTTTNGLGGLILRPAMLMSGTTLTSPILRGVFVQRKILCAQLPAPDANVVKARVDTANLSHKDHANREYFTLLTSPAACTGCHSQVNSIGFTMEQFGPLGQPRQIETIYDQNGPTGVTHPIATAVDDLHIDPSRALPATGAADAIEQIAESPKARACFDAALIINTRYRPLDATDNCLMSELADIQSSNRPVMDALVQNVANDGIFWKSAKGVQ